MVLRTDGGMYITNTGGLAPYNTARLINTSSGAYLTTGGVWTNSSDRNLKENFMPIDGQEILELLEQLEIKQWNYKEDDENITHIGPVAQDFYALFGLGSDDKAISTVDPAGIALAAIQELHRENIELKKTVETLQAKVEVTENLKTQITQLTSIVEKLAAAQKANTSVNPSFAEREKSNR